MSERVVSTLRTRFGDLPESRQRRLVQFGTLLVLAVGWEALGTLLGPVFLAPLSSVVRTYLDLLLEGPMLGLLLGTLYDMSVGLVLAVAVGVPTGFLMGRSRAGHDLFNPHVSGLLVISTSSLLPLLLVLFGLGFDLRIVVVWLASVAHVTINVYHGAAGIDSRYLDVSRSFDLPLSLQFRRVLLPATLPFVMGGLRLGLGRAIQGILLVETYTLVGYGGLIYQYGTQSVSTAPVLALILTIMALAYVGRRGLEAVERRVAPWTAAGS